MEHFFKVLSGNLLLSKGPQDFSCSLRLMRLILIVYFITGFPGLMIDFNFGQAVLAMILDVSVLVLFIYLSLQAFSKSERFVQSVICLASIGIVFQLIVLPVLYSINPAAEAAVHVPGKDLLLSLLLFIFIAWNLAVFAHVVKSSFGVRLSRAMVLTIGYFAITVFTQKAVFPGLV